MTRSSIKELVNYDPEIERSFRLRRKRQALSFQSIAYEGMENQEIEDIQLPFHVEDQFDEVAPRPANPILRDYARPDRFNYESSIRKPPVAANNFEIRTGLIQTIQQSCIFNGDASEDPHSHLIDFLELVETSKYNGVPPEAIKLWLFPFFLKGDAKTWLRSFPQCSITTWNQMAQKNLNKYFSPAKTTKLRQDISTFLQTDTESVYQALERLKAMLRKCSYHDIPEHMQLYIFYHDLKLSSRNVIDAAGGGSIMGKTTKEALQLLNEISENAIQWPSERAIIKKAAMVNQVDALNTLTQQIVSLAQMFETFQVNTQQPSQSEDPLPSNTEKNPNEHLKAITLWSGKELDETYADQSKQQVNNGKNVEIPSEPSEKKEVKKKEEKNIEKLNLLPMIIPFPQKMKRENLDSQFTKFLEILKQIHINVPFTDALLPMPSYAKVLKEILSTKRKLEEVSVVILTEKCSAILQNKLPQKLGDRAVLQFHALWEEYILKKHSVIMELQ
ncbi:uncharacterized protein [Nicotiana sylvestris]|uniref:uncharacterized protein n=1 Tax=Nicotiana sylvestris TaxID=4096 RepID=UPI00388CE5F1